MAVFPFNINQSDLAERATEVAKISAIFSRAVKTLVWLGQGNSRIEADMVALANCNVEKANLTSRPGGTGLPTRRAVDSILEVTYWKRAWVVQELMYSDEVLLLYGSSSVSFDHFIKIVDSEIQEIWLDLSDIKVGDAKLAIRPGSGRRKEYLRLPTWLENYCCQRDCTESRDRVFAYHGCFPPVVRKCVRPDYTRSMEQVAMDITIAWIDSERNLEFLSEIGRRGKLRSRQKVPTWIPNYFGTPVNISRLIDPSESASKTAVRPYFRVFNDSSVLEVKGIWLGAIETIGKQSTNTERSQVKGLDTYLLDQVLRCEGSINNLEPGLKDLINTTFDREDLQSKFAEDHHIIQNISASCDSSKDGEVLYIFDRLLDVLSSHNRISFRFTPVENSRSVQKGSVSIPFGLGTPELKLGDRLCLVVGCTLALILRSVGKQYMVVGNAYVFGFHSGLDLQNKLSEYPSSVVDNLNLC